MVNSRSLLAAGVFGHSFGSFTDSVFRQFTGEKKPDLQINWHKDRNPRVVIGCVNQSVLSIVVIAFHSI